MFMTSIAVRMNSPLRDQHRTETGDFGLARLRRCSILSTPELVHPRLKETTGGDFRVLLLL